MALYGFLIAVYHHWLYYKIWLCSQPQLYVLCILERIKCIHATTQLHTYYNYLLPIVSCWSIICHTASHPTPSTAVNKSSS